MKSSSLHLWRFLSIVAARDWSNYTQFESTTVKEEEEEKYK